MAQAIDRSESRGTYFKCDCSRRLQSRFYWPKGRAIDTTLNLPHFAAKHQHLSSLGELVNAADWIHLGVAGARETSVRIRSGRDF
jgi:hypothetical protein